MLFYLDNFLSADPRAAERATAERTQKAAARWGAWSPLPSVRHNPKAEENHARADENYGRELMELHTLAWMVLFAKGCDGSGALL